jgi:glucose-6-phosphate 1-epimerase
MTQLSITILCCFCHSGYGVVDKVSNTEYTADSHPITIQGETDRVYNPPSGKTSVQVIVGVGEGKEMKATASGIVDGEEVAMSCVVWNPYIEKAKDIGDFGDDQYDSMLCVEPLLGGTSPMDLEGGKTAKLIQTLEML